MRLWLVWCLLVAEYATVAVVGWGTHGRAASSGPTAKTRRMTTMAEKCSQMGYIMPSQPEDPGGTRGTRSFSFREHIHRMSPNLYKVFFDNLGLL